MKTNEKTDRKISKEDEYFFFQWPSVFLFLFVNDILIDI